MKIKIYLLMVVVLSSFTYAGLFSNDRAIFNIVNQALPDNVTVRGTLNALGDTNLYGVTKVYGSFYYMNISDLVTNRETINSTTVNASEVFTTNAYVSNRVGIGTTTPTHTLTVVGTTNLTGNVYMNLTNITNVTMGFNTNTKQIIAIFPSSYVSNSVTDETGSGSLVFGTSPTLTTMVVGTYIRGGTTNTTNLTLITTSAQSAIGVVRFGFLNVGGTFNYPVVITNRSIGIGTQRPIDNLHISASNSQLRIEDIDDGNFTQLSYSTDQLIFRMNTVSGNGALSVIDSNKVGINITASVEPAQTFTVQGTANITKKSFFGENITLISPSGTNWNCGVSDTGVWSCS